MSARRPTLALVLGVFVAVVSVITVAVLATTGRTPGTEAPAAATSGSTTSTDDAITLASGDDAAPDSLVAALPDNAAAAPLQYELVGVTGTVVASGREVVVERVPLSSSRTVTVDGVARDVDAVYRVTISAGPYVVGAMPAVVSADGRSVGVATESVDLSNLVLTTFDDAITVAGTDLAVTYGLPGSAPASWTSTLEVGR